VIPTNLRQEIHLKRLISICLLPLAAAASIAGQVCTPDPPRPSGNTGIGLYTAPDPATGQWKLWNDRADEVLMHGVDHNHWDAYGAPAGLPLSGANAVRIFLRFSDPPETTYGFVKPISDAGLIPIPTNWTTTCKSDPLSLQTAVDTWVKQASTWTRLNTYGLINIANEWGPVVSGADHGLGWLTENTTAVRRMRAAGYTMPLVVDAGGCGQDAGTIVKYGKMLQEADPQHNILFDVHVYGSWHYPATASWMQDYATAMAQLKASKLPVMVGEFGPYNGGASSSKTLVPTAKLVADIETNGWSWFAWSWSDNNLPNCASDDSGFGMTKKCGVYRTDDDLTTWGRTVVPLLKSHAPPKP
jgi:mannan endo-1,4-beta-mannosidase